MTTSVIKFIQAQGSFIQQWQEDILKLFLDEKEPNYVDYYRKGWESKYDPKFTKGTGYQPRRTPPDVSSLPDKRWVAPRPPSDPEEALDFYRDMKEWLSERKVKNQECEVLINGKPTMVRLFKKPKDALMFKLTWG